MDHHLEQGALGLPAIVLHGGAGTFGTISGEEDERRLEEALAEARDAGWAVLAAGGAALEAVVEAVASLEDSGSFNAGRGAVPTSAGTVEFDASVMDGTSGAVGALCSVRYPANPVRAALALAREGGVPDGPILLAGAGGDAFCERRGLPPMEESWLTRPGARLGATSQEGTVGAVAVDSAGRLAAATSTGGRAGQWPGRVGDSPIPGAGVLAERERVAVSATGAGEAFLVAGFAHRISWGLAAGRELAATLGEALEAVGALGGTGGGITLSPSGQFAAAFSTPAMARAWRGPASRQARIFPS